MKRYVINFGYDSNGRPRNRYFDNLNDAIAVADLHFRRTGVVVAIDEVAREGADDREQ